MMHARLLCFCLALVCLCGLTGCQPTSSQDVSASVPDRPAADLGEPAAPPATDTDPPVGAAGTNAVSAEPAEPAVPAAEPAGTPPRASDRRADRAAGRQDRSTTTSGVRDCTFDDIKFEMEKEDPFQRSMLTSEIEAMVGRRIRIRGYILPSFQQSGLRQFVLVRDNMECCFGPGAALYDCILVDMKPGQSTNFTIRPVAVEGTFSVRELIGPGDRHLAIYHLEADLVN